MDRDTRKQAQLACQISLGLMAGIFSILPTAAASPVQDTTSTGKAIQSGNFKINQSGTTDKGGTLTAITSESTNNVIPWKDFSVGAKEKVQFDNGQKTNNYLNVVTGANTSHIAGEIEGGNNVYIVNQHGVIFDEGSTVNVGNLYVSTKAAGNSDTVKAAINNTDSAVLTAATTGNAVSDVVNLGTLSADVIQVEGKNIRFLDSANVLKADGVTRNTSDVTLTASGYAHVGHDATTGASTTGYTQGSGGKAIEDYTLVSTLGEIGTTGNYMLSQDIDASKEKAQYDSAPIDSFNGNLDGMFYEVQNLNISSGGNAALFGTTTGGRIENLGIIDATISSSGKKSYAAAVVGDATNTTILNVYNENGSVSGILAGGLVGHLQSGSTLKSSYNTASVVATSAGGGLAGRIEDGSSITDCYNSGNVTGGAKSYGIGYNIGKNATITRVYNTGSEQSGKLVYETSNVSLDHDFASSTSGEQNASTYASWDLSDDGTTNTTWRIYEGQSTPYLTAFFKGDTTATYDYNYFTESGTTATQTGLHRAGVTSADGVQAVSNNGADVTVTYNGQYYKIANPTTTTDSDGNTVVTTSTDADDVKGYVSFGSNVDGTDSNITINTAGLKDVKATDATASSTSPTVTKQSLISSGQHGYNIVGGNVTINQRTVTVSNDLTDKTLTKTYDGTKDVAASDIKSLFTGSTTSGLIDGDDTVTLTFNGTAKYASKNAGTHKVTLNGNLALTNTSGYNNYKLDSKSAASFNNAEVDGVIKQKKLTLSMNSGINLTREYNGKNNSKVAATSDSSTGVTGGLINSANPASNVFTIDGVVTDKAVDDNTEKGRPDVVTIGFTGDYAGDYVDSSTDANGNVTYTKTGKAGDHTVEYSGLTLESSTSDAANYYLADADGNIIYRAAVDGVNDAASNNLYVTGGKITKKNISSNSFTMGTKGATKVYDGNAYYDTGVDTVLNSDNIVSYTDSDNNTTYDDVNFKVATATSGENNGHSAWFSKTTTDTSGNTTTTKVKDAGTGYGITYNVEISGEDVDNYTLDGKEITLDKTTKKASGEVTGKTTDGVVNSITQRIIKLGLGTKTSGIDKDYDGTDTVYVTDGTTKRSDLKLSDALIAYADDGSTTETTSTPTATNDLHKLIAGDGVSLKIEGHYAGSDVVVGNDTDKNPQAQAITYTVSLDGNDTLKNYALESENTYTETISTKNVNGTNVTPMGTIKPRTITASVKNPLTKEYDTLANTYYLYDTNKVGGTALTADDIEITSGNLVSDDDKTKIFDENTLKAINESGKYGYLDDSGTFHEDANVLTDTNQIKKATARFTGFASGTNNYKLSSSTVDATGSKITPYQITDVDLDVKNVTKVYDGKSGVATSADDLQNGEHTAASYINGISATHNGQKIDLTYDTIGDKDAYYIHKSDTDTGTEATDVSQANAARFLLKIKTESPNYTIADSLKNSDGKVTLDTATNGANITKRKLLASVTDPSKVTKEYDGQKAIDETGDDAVTLTDINGRKKGLVDDAKNTSTGAFETKDVSYDHTKNVYNDKNIYYYVSLDKSEGNYDVYAADGKTSIGFNTTPSESLKGVGTITAKTLTLDFGKVSKTFTNTTALDDGDITSTNGTVGKATITGFENNESFEATTNLKNSSYDDANVGTGTKDVMYSISFSDAAAENYRLSDTAAPIVTGNAYTVTSNGNTITPKTIKNTDIAPTWKTISKTYDGSEQVTYDHSGAQYIKDDTKGIDETGKVEDAGDYVEDLLFGGISLKDWSTKNNKTGYTVDSATYGDASASKTTGDKTVTYQFDINADFLKNFDLTESVNKGDLTIYTKDGTKNLFEKSTTGTITPKYFDLTFTPVKDHSQVYNGKTALVTNDQTLANNTGTALDLTKTVAYADHLIKSSDATGLTTVAGAYDDADAGTGKDITYTVTLNNDNYQFLTDATGKTSNDGTGTFGTNTSGVQTMTYTGTGDIEQKELTLNVTKQSLVKEYDGSAAVEDDDLKNNVTFDGLVGSENLTPYVNTCTDADNPNGLTGTYVSSKEATKGQAESDVEWEGDDATGGVTWKAVTLANIDKALENATSTNGAKVSNYKIADTSVTYDKSQEIGKITPLTIDKVTTSWSDITKEYDNTADVLNPENYFHINVNTTTSAGKVINTEIAYNVKSATYAGKDVGSYDVTYTFDGLKNSSLHNFKLSDDITDAYATGKTLQSAKQGTITPRKIYAQFDPDVTRALTTKEYNGDNTLTGADKTQAELTSYVKYSNLLSQTDGATDDGAVVNVVTTFDDKNVAYDADGNVTTKALNYKLSIGGDGVKASNYAFYDGTTATSATPTALTNDTLTDATGGKITQKQLTVTGASLAEKTYDTTDTVNNPSGITFTLDGLVSGDSGFAITSGYVTGKYKDANVTREEQSETGVVAGQDTQDTNYYYKGVTYSGFENALKKMRTNDGNTIAGNYKIADTVYFDEAKQAGVIKPLAITADAIKEKWAASITKPYDATTAVNNPKSQLTYSATVDGTTYDIAYDLASAVYNSKDVNAANMVTYTINGIDTTALRNYDMGDAARNVILGNNGVHTLTNGQTTSDNVTHTVAITPKVIDVALQKTQLADKVYDATTAVKDRTNSLIIDNGKDDGNVAGEAEADKVKVVLGEDYVYGSKNVGTQTVTYTAKLENNDKGNYTLKDGATTDKERDEKTLDAKGEITARPVYVDFKGGVVPTNIDKEYGETTLPTVDATNVNDAKREVLHPENYRPLVVAADKADNSGIVDSDVSLDTDNIKLLYANNGNVARKADGSVTTQTVLFDNVNLKDSTSDASGNAKNYEIVYSNTNHTATDYDNKTVLAGQGTITPKAITVTYDNDTNIKKTYDGTSTADVSKIADALNAAVANPVTTGTSLLLGNDTLNFTVTGKYTKDGAAYTHTNKTAGLADGGLGVQTQVSWTNGNYDVTFSKKNSTKQLDQTDTEPMVKDGTATFSKTVDTTQGTITPRKLTVSGGEGASKTYTGDYSTITGSFTSSDTPNTSKTSGVVFNNIAPDEEKDVLIATGTGTFYDVNDATKQVKDAADSVDEDATTRKVKWDIVLQNKDYTLDGTDAETVEGTGVIKRAPLTFVSSSVSGRYGQTPTFTGSVRESDWKTTDDRTDYENAVAANPSLVTWSTAPDAPSRGSSSIYGWYRYDDATGTGNSWSYDPNPNHASSGTDIYATKGADAYRNFGNYGRNYKIVQEPGIYTAQADAPKMDDVNLAKHFRPDMEAYNYASHDEAGTVIRDPKAGIEYEAGGTSLSTDGSAAYSGTMTVEGAGEIVNLTQSGTTASADRVDLTGDGANYTLSGAENVPTADVTVADVTEDVASATTTASATAAAGTTSAASTTSADDTTVTDDDDDAVKAAAESSDEREAEATVEYADQAPSLFSEAITGTNVAS